MIGALYYKLQELEFEEYVSRQIGDEEKNKSIKRKINKLIKKIESEVNKEKEKK